MLGGSMFGRNATLRGKKAKQSDKQYSATRSMKIVRKKCD